MKVFHENTFLLSKQFSYWYPELYSTMITSFSYYVFIRSLSNLYRSRFLQISNQEFLKFTFPIRLELFQF